MLIFCFLTISSYSSCARLCIRPNANSIECKGLTSEEQYYNELSSLEVGSNNFLEHNELIINGNPFVGELTRNVFEFNRTKQIASSITPFKFIRLQKIVLTNGNISSIHPNAFLLFCRYLKYVCLARNALREIPSAAFLCSNGSLLTHLNLSGNAIQAITGNSLSHLKKLQELDLSNNALFSIDDFAFDGTYLKALYLNKNQLKTLSERSFLVFTMRKPSSLTLYLRDNHLNCDCHLRWLSVWLAHADSSLIHDDPSCLGPLNKHERSIKQMHANEFVCNAVITAAGGGSGGEAVAYEGDRVTLKCEVFSNPKPNVWWTFKDRYTIGKALNDKIVGRYNVSTNRSADDLNVTSILVIDQVQSGDSGDFRCFASIHNQDDVSTSDVVFHLRVKPRHFGTSSSGLWALILSLCVIFSIAFILVYFLWKKWNKSRKNSNNAKLLEDGMADGGGLSLLAEHLGPPMYTTPPSIFTFPYAATPSAYAKANNAGTTTTDENDFDLSGYDEDYHFTDDIYKPGQPLDPRRLKSLKEPSLLFNETEL